jgi:hypothetical protein
MMTTPLAASAACTVSIEVPTTTMWPCSSSHACTASCAADSRPTLDFIST